MLNEQYVKTSKVKICTITREVLVLCAIHPKNRAIRQKKII